MRADKEEMNRLSTDKKKQFVRVFLSAVSAAERETVLSSLTRI